MSKQTIWSYLKQAGLSDEATAALMGNFECESNCEACRVQGDFSPNRDTSKDYARQVNGGSISAYQYIHDSKGWGLAQWTYSSRKQNLLEFCWDTGRGIEDEQAQLEFALNELKVDFPSLWNIMSYSTDIKQMSDLICRNFENPAIKNYDARYTEAQKIYNQYHGTHVDDDVTDTKSKIISLLKQTIELIEKL